MGIMLAVPIALTVLWPSLSSDPFTLFDSHPFGGWPGLVIVAMVGLVLLVISMQNDTTPIGYVDHSGLLVNPLPAPVPEKPEKPVPMVPFTTEEDARSALNAGQIQAYYVNREDYLSSGKLTLFDVNPVKDLGRRQFYCFLTVNLLRDFEPQVAKRLVEGGNVVIISPDGSRSASSRDWFSFP